MTLLVLREEEEKKVAPLSAMLPSPGSEGFNILCCRSAQYSASLSAKEFSRVGCAGCICILRVHSQRISTSTRFCGVALTCHAALRLSQNSGARIEAIPTEALSPILGSCNGEAFRATIANTIRIADFSNIRQLFAAQNSFGHAV